MAQFGGAMPIIIPISIFVFIVLIAISLYWILRPKNVAADRLEELRKQGINNDNSAVATESTVEKLAERIAQPINRVAPPSAAHAHKLQKKLMHAGYRSPMAPVIYRAIRIITLFGFPAMTALILTSMGYSLIGSLLWIVVALGIGFILPSYILDNILIDNRQQRLRWGLADALDLLVISIEAGLGLNQAMVRVSEEMKNVHPDISEEFELLNLEIRVGREREEALRNLAERTGIEDMRGLCAMMIQADRFGTSIARAIRVYSDSLRTKRRQRAEQTAQKAAIKLLIPLALFLFPTLFIAILGPAFLQLMDNFNFVPK
jgi:tight adherence protein C